MVHIAAGVSGKQDGAAWRIFGAGRGSGRHGAYLCSASPWNDTLNSAIHPEGLDPPILGCEVRRAKTHSEMVGEGRKKPFRIGVQGSDFHKGFMVERDR